MQTIIKLPQKRKDLMTAGIGESVVARLDKYSEFAQEIQSFFKDIVHLCDFIRSAVSNDLVYYVRTFSEDLKDSSETREFICFGEYNRDIRHSQHIFFRVDQNWNNFNFSIFNNVDDFERYFYLLSGTCLSTILPPFLLEQNNLNDTSDVLTTKNVKSIDLEGLYLFSTDYFSKSYFLNSSAEVFFLDPAKGKITRTDFSFKEWVSNLLNGILNPATIDYKSNGYC
jgi:hypothetical protein